MCRRHDRSTLTLKKETALPELEVIGIDIGGKLLLQNHFLQVTHCLAVHDIHRKKVCRLVQYPTVELYLRGAEGLCLRRLLWHEEASVRAPPTRSTVLTAIVLFHPYITRLMSTGFPPSAGCLLYTVLKKIGEIRLNLKLTYKHSSI